MKFHVVMLAVLLGPTTSQAQSIASVQRMETEWAARLNSGRTAELANRYDEGAWLILPGGPPAKGRTAIQGALQELARHAKTMRVQTTSVLPLGRDYLLEDGIGRFQPAGSAPTTEAVSNYQVLWRRGHHGEWKIVRDVVSAQ